MWIQEIERTQNYSSSIEMIQIHTIYIHIQLQIVEVTSMRGSRAVNEVYEECIRLVLLGVDIP